MPENPWTPYEPNSGQWSLQQAAHLLRRTTFGFTPAQLQQALADGPQKTIDRLLATAAGYAEFEASVAALTPRESSTLEAAHLWLYRILNTPYPFLEKMTLFWRDAFGSRDTKLDRASAMQRHIDELRQNALGVREGPVEGVVPSVVKWLCGSRAVDVGPLAQTFARDRDVRRLVATILGSNYFFSPDAWRTRIKTPIEFALGLANAIGAPLAPAQLHSRLGALGQHIPEPSGDRRWLNSFTIVARSNLAAAIIAKIGHYPDRRTLLDTLLQRDLPTKLEGRELVQAIANSKEFQLA